MNNTEICLKRVLQKHLSASTPAHVFIYHEKDRKQSSKHKWTERKYHVQCNKDIQKKTVKRLCAVSVDIRF